MTEQERKHEDEDEYKPTSAQSTQPTARLPVKYMQS